MKIKISKELGICEMPRAQTNICHLIGGTRDVVMQQKVAVKTLVMCLQPQQIRRWPCHCCRSFSQPVNVSYIIGQGTNRSLRDIGKLGNYIMMSDVTTQFKVTVGDSPIAISK